jgi:hypothetical protein
VDLYADKTRTLPFLDPHRRELTISCGVALFYLRLSLRWEGFGERAEILPVTDAPDLMARVWIDDPVEHTFEDAQLFAAVPHRRTNRLSFENRPLPESLPAELVRAAADEGAALTLVTDKQVHDTLVELIVTGARELGGSEEFRQEMAEWSGRAQDGFDAETGVKNFPHEVGRQLAYSGPFWSPVNAGEVFAAHEARLAREAPLLAILSTEGDVPADWLAAGQALARVLLSAAGTGVMAAFLNAPIQVERLRLRIDRLVGEERHAQLLLGLGYAPYGTPTPRRPVQATLLP